MRFRDVLIDVKIIPENYPYNQGISITNDWLIFEVSGPRPTRYTTQILSSCDFFPWQFILVASTIFGK